MISPTGRAGNRLHPPQQRGEDLSDLGLRRGRQIRPQGRNVVRRTAGWICQRRHGSIAFVMLKAYHSLTKMSWHGRPQIKTTAPRITILNTFYKSEDVGF